ncbi:hypothetical protein E9230_001397 [Corynebacterium glutamicum]|nr:hypothetical protein [Corynebacterium glutamicum]NII96956.1 hypothetical protein [Corynebacterium glutamicum]
MLSAMSLGYLCCAFLKIFDEGAEKDERFRRIGLRTEREVTSVSRAVS